MKKIIILLIVITAFVGCKKDKQKENTIKKEISQEEVKKEYPKFTVNITAKVLKDDRFRLLYTEELGENFSSKKLLFKKVIGKDSLQTITFELPKEKIYPVSLRINVGENENQESIQIESIELLHDDNSFFIPKEKFSKYFYPNKDIEFDDMGLIKFRKTKGKRFPFFVSRGPLHEELESF